LNIVTTAAAAAIIALPAAPAHAAVTPISASGCIVHPIGPHKVGYGSTAPISFGFQVACYPRDPDMRAVTVKLWRKNVHTGQIYMHAERTDHGTKAMDEKTYDASCSGYSAGHDDGNSDPRCSTADQEGWHP
jgi:hypothetical protein